MPNLNVGLGAAMPAFAESFPSNGLMLENKTYSGAATFENMGTYDGDGTLSAIAEYVDNTQDIIGGTYLPAGATVAEQCPANHWCYGKKDATVNASESQGAEQCANTMPYSAVGSVSNTQCYTTCTLKSANIEHATAVSGNDYYGTGTDTCSATDCESGYHVYETVKVIEQPPLIDVDVTLKANGYSFVNGNGQVTQLSDSTDYGLTESNTWAVGFDYGVVYGRASCHATALSYTVYDYMYEIEDLMDAGETISLDQFRSDLTTIVGVATANYIADSCAGYYAAWNDYVVNGGTTMSEEEADVLYADCNDDLGIVLDDVARDASFSPSGTGEYCYCQITGFLSEPRDDESGLYEISRAVAIESAPWVLFNINETADWCADSCAQDCVHFSLGVVSPASGRMLSGALMGARDFVAAGTCVANEIEIRWSDAAEEDIAATNAGMCTYGGDIRTPIKAATIPGKTFVGWKFLPQEYPE